MNKKQIREFISAMDSIVAEKGIDKSVVVEAMEQAMAAAYKKKGGPARCVVNPDTGEIKLFSVKTVVDDENFYDERSQIPLSEAQKQVDDIEIGETIERQVEMTDFGRVAAGTAKQVVVQRIKEADKELIPGEKLEMGSQVKAYVSKLEIGNKGVFILLSRKHYGFLKRLLEIEIPEINDGTVMLYSVAREAGIRSKVAVYSDKENIEPVGCVIGANGSRINRVLKQIAKEKIDVVLYDKNPVEFIKNALSPAKDIEVFITDPKKKMATCIVNKDNLSLAIGKKGINIKLAARLTHYKLDVKCIDDVNIDEYREKYSDIKNIDETPEEEKGEVKDIEEVVETDEENSNA